MLTIRDGKFWGKSTDEKPKVAENGQPLYEMDTGKVYLFDMGGGEWLLQEFEKNP